MYDRTFNILVWSTTLETSQQHGQHRPVDLVRWYDGLYRVTIYFYFLSPCWLWWKLLAFQANEPVVRIIWIEPTWASSSVVFSQIGQVGVVIVVGLTFAYPLSPMRSVAS